MKAPFHNVALTAATVIALLAAARGQETLEVLGSWAYPTGAAPENAPGFVGTIVQAPKNAGLTATIARGNAHLNGTLIDPATDAPYENLVVDSENAEFKSGDWEGSPVAPGGTFVHTGVVNFSTDGFGFPIELGNFDSNGNQEDLPFPGIPGSDDDSFSTYENAQNFSAEFITFIELPAGETILGVAHDDAVEIALHPNDARDIFRIRAVGFDSNSGNADRTVVLNVAEAGLYSVRLLLAQWNGSTQLEFYSENDGGDLVLVNDAEAGDAPKAYQSITQNTRPYISSVNPGINATGVVRDSKIEITVENLGEGEATVKVNGTDATFAKATDGTATTLTHTPDSPFDSGATVEVEVSYGAATSKWTFVAESGSKALLITGGGQLNGADGWIANRLATKFGFDVVVKADGSVTTDDADEAALVFNSSTVNSGQVGNDDFEELPIPMVNVEAGNVDDFLLADAPFGWGNGPGGGSDSVAIVDASHPIAAGLAEGEITFSDKSIQYHWGIPPESAAVIARPTGNEEQGILYAIEAGAEIITDDEEPFVHPARRVFLGFTGNDGAASYNENGIALFDAAIAWALGTAIAPPALAFTVVRYDAAGDKVTLAWVSADGASYTVSESDDLATWSEINDGVAATGTETTFEITGASAQTKYYRIGLEQ